MIIPNTLGITKVAVAAGERACNPMTMTAEVRSDRYRKVAEKELEHGNPRDPVLNESIEAAAENGADLTEEYARRRTEQMLADEQEREAMEKRRMKLQRELDDQEPKMLMRTLILVSIIVLVAAIGYWISKH